MLIRTGTVSTHLVAAAQSTIVRGIVPVMALGLLLSSTAPAQTSSSPGAAEASDYTLACAIAGAPGMAAVRPCAELGAAQRCRHESDFSSRPSQERTGMTIVNRSGHALKLYWLNFSGARKLYRTVSPGDQVTQQTFLGHNWLIETAEGDCVGIFNASPAAIAFF
jgi:hypothetical protein